jgi:hypothetical protein
LGGTRIDFSFRNRKNWCLFPEKTPGPKVDTSEKMKGNGVLIYHSPEKKIDNLAITFDYFYHGKIFLIRKTQLTTIMQVKLAQKKKTLVLIVIRT